jgi:hypothetical protein
MTDKCPLHNSCPSFSSLDNYSSHLIAVHGVVDGGEIMRHFVAEMKARLGILLDSGLGILSQDINAGK